MHELLQSAGKCKPRGGSRKGCPNRNTKALKDMILGALAKSGGEDYLVARAKDNPTAFLTLIGKVLPTTLVGDKTQPLAFTRIELVAGESVGSTETAAEAG